MAFQPIHSNKLTHFDIFVQIQFIKNYLRNIKRLGHQNIWFQYLFCFISILFFLCSNFPECKMFSRREKKESPRVAVEFSSIAEFLSKSRGHRRIERVLIANNGIAAVKCIRSIRRWCYETFRNERAGSSYIKRSHQIFGGI